MNDAEVLKDLDRSLNIVDEKIKPIVEKLLPGWKMMRVEGRDNEVCQVLDMSCGVDYLLVSGGCDMIYGAASRVQYGKNYRTFTVRKSRESGATTEYEKRLLAIQHKAIWPHYNLQAYITGEDVSGLAIVKTEDLIDFISRDLADVKQTNADKIGQAEFYVSGMI